MKIGILSQKGGAGKTTTALGLAGALAHTGRKILLVDADPQGTASAWASHRRLVGLAPLPGLTLIQHPAGDMLKRLQQPDVASYDDIIIDGPPRADEALSRSVIAAAADIVLIPVQASLADLWAARATVALVKQGWASGLKNRGAFVLSRLKPGTALGRDFAEVLKGEGLPLLPAGTHDRTAYAAALSSCQTIHEFEPPAGKARQEMDALLAAVQTLS